MTPLRMRGRFILNSKFCLLFMEKEKFTPPEAREKEIDEWDVPIDSNLEEEMLDKFCERELNTEEDFTAAVTEVYDEICGEHGRKEFMGIVLPQIKKFIGVIIAAQV